jgi:hypothetical protein
MIQKISHLIKTDPQLKDKEFERRPMNYTALDPFERIKPLSPDYVKEKIKILADDVKKAAQTDHVDTQVTIDEKKALDGKKAFFIIFTTHEEQDKKKLKELAKSLIKKFADSGFHNPANGSPANCDFNICIEDGKTTIGFMPREEMHVIIKKLAQATKDPFYSKHDEKNALDYLKNKINKLSAGSEPLFTVNDGETPSIIITVNALEGKNKHLYAKIRSELKLDTIPMADSDGHYNIKVNGSMSSLICHLTMQPDFNRGKQNGIWR